MRRGTKLAAVVTVAALSLMSAPAHAERAVMSGLGTQNILIEFDTASPDYYVEHPVTGLGDRRIWDVAVRPANGKLYALTSDLTGLDQIYVVDTTTWAATLVGPTPGLHLSANNMSFDPVTDQIRVIGSAGANARLNPDTGARIDDPVHDTELPGHGSLEVMGVAYDRRSSPPPGATTLYAIDNHSDTLGIIGGVNGTPSPNAGGYTPIAPLGTVSDNQVGFDISPQTGNAYAILTEGTSVSFYRIALTPGTAPVATYAGRAYTGVVPMDVLAILPGDGPKRPVTCLGKPATIVGTEGNDKLKGTKRSDVIVTLGGKDKVTGGGGNDRICGGDGNDKLKGGDGKDKIDGGDGKDTLSGQGDNDNLIGSAGRGDRCIGGGGRDTAARSCETSISA